MKRLLLVVLIVLGLAGGVSADPCAAGASCDEDTTAAVVATPAVVAKPAPAVVAKPAAAPVLPVLDPPPSVAPPAPDEGPSLAVAVLRLLGSVLIVALLLVACVTGYRRLVHHAATRPGGMLGWVARAADERDPDFVRIGSRRYLGARDSVAVVHAGGERFLVGISSAGITLLSRLESPVATTESAPATFGEALSRAADPRADMTPSAERALRAAVERSRARLASLGAPEGPRA
jgi:flagellar biogenesis protein FliO